MFLQYEMGDQSFHRSLPLPQTKQTPLLPFAVTSLGDYTCDKRYFTKREGLGECLLLYTVAGGGIPWLMDGAKAVSGSGAGLPGIPVLRSPKGKLAFFMDSLYWKMRL